MFCIIYRETDFLKRYIESLVQELCRLGYYVGKVVFPADASDEEVAAEIRDSSEELKGNFLLTDVSTGSIVRNTLGLSPKRLSLTCQLEDWLQSVFVKRNFLVSDKLWFIHNPDPVSYEFNSNQATARSTIKALAVRAS